MDMEGLYQLAISDPKVKKLAERFEAIIEAFEQLYKERHYERFFGQDPQVAFNQVMAHTLEIYNLNSQADQDTVNSLRAAFILAIKNIYEFRIGMLDFKSIMQLDAVEVQDDKSIIKALLKIEEQFLKGMLKSGHFIPTFREGSKVEESQTEAQMAGSLSDQETFFSSVERQMSSALRKLDRRNFGRGLGIATHVYASLNEAQELIDFYAKRPQNPLITKAVTDLQNAMEDYFREAFTSIQSTQAESGTNRQFQMQCEKVFYETEQALYKGACVHAAFKEQSQVLKGQLAKIDRLIFELFEQRPDLLKHEGLEEAIVLREKLADLKELKREYFREQLEKIALTGQPDPNLSQRFIEEGLRLIAEAKEEFQWHPDILSALSALTLSFMAVELQDKSHIRQSDLLQMQLNRVYRASSVLTNKANQLDLSGSREQAEETREIAADLDGKMKAYFSGQLANIKASGQQNSDLTHKFKQDCKEFVNEAKSRLNMPRSIWPVLGNILLAVASVGILPAISRVASGSWTFFDTDRYKQLQQVHQSIEVNVQ